MNGCPSEQGRWDLLKVPVAGTEGHPFWTVRTIFPPPNSSPATRGGSPATGTARCHGQPGTFWTQLKMAGLAQRMSRTPRFFRSVVTRGQPRYARKRPTVDHVRNLGSGLRPLRASVLRNLGSPCRESLPRSGHSEVRLAPAVRDGYGDEQTSRVASEVGSPWSRYAPGDDRSL
jgi:hypothetical protein